MTKRMESNKALILRGMVEAAISRGGDYDHEIQVHTGSARVVVRRRNAWELKWDERQAFKDIAFSEYPEDFAVKAGYDATLSCIIKLEHAQGNCVA